MKEDDEAVSSLEMQLLAEDAAPADVWRVKESRPQEWRSGQVSIDTTSDFTVGRL
jgi:hypothetical protein